MEETRLEQEGSSSGREGGVKGWGLGGGSSFQGVGGGHGHLVPRGARI